MYQSRDILIICNLYKRLPFNILTSNNTLIMKFFLPLLVIPFITSCQKDEVQLKKESPIEYTVTLEVKNGGGSLQINTNNKELNPIHFKSAINCSNNVSTTFKIQKGDQIVGFADLKDCDLINKEFPKKAYLTISSADKTIKDSIVLTSNKVYGTKVIIVE